MAYHNHAVSFITAVITSCHVQIYHPWMSGAVVPFRAVLRVPLRFQANADELTRQTIEYKQEVFDRVSQDSALFMAPCGPVEPVGSNYSGGHFLTKDLEAVYESYLLNSEPRDGPAHP